jgi:diadenosine tetraphosphate (Ap4A) HIT family hydrolase
MERIFAPWRIRYILAPKPKECIFCEYPKQNKDRENLILYRGRSCYIIMNRNPYNPGHVMVCPYRHISSTEDMTDEEMLESMKRARECLQGADDSLEANSCIEELNTFKAKMAKEDKNHIDTWNKKEKNRILDEFDENIAVLESRMKCIRAAMNISDLSSCMSK